MFRIVTGFILVVALLTACKNGEDEDDQEQNGNSSQGISSLFKEAKTQYQLSDTGLLKITDTASIPAEKINVLLSDSLKNYFGKNAAIRFTPLARFEQKGKENYYLVKASAKNKSAAILLVADNEKKFTTSFPFLLPDNDPNTGQVSIFDKNFTTTKTTTLKSGHEIIGEGKHIFTYDASSKNFTLIMEDRLEDNPKELRNPIDTFPKTHKLAGDYFLNKKNIISVRDGRYPNQLLVFIHTENAAGDCIGQMRGEFVLTSSTTAVYRQGGDPCVLNMNFKGNTVSVAEERGCGNYRGLDCVFNGTFTRKKSSSAKQGSTKTKPK